MQENKRGRVRANFKTTIHIRFDDKFFKDCISENISVNGLLVKHDEKVTVDDLCEVNIILENDTNTEIDIKVFGKVSRITDNGFAINFSHMEYDSLMHLRNIVKYNTDHIDDFIKECHKSPGFR